MVTRGIRLWLALGAAMLASAQAHAYRTNEFKSGETRPVTIALLPVAATVARTQEGQEEPVVEESPEMGELLAAEIARILEAKGYVVEIVDQARVESDLELGRQLAAAMGRYEEVKEHLWPGHVKRRYFEVGEPARVLADNLDVDALAFSKLHSAPGRASGILANALAKAWYGFETSVALVDRHTGIVEAYFSSSGSGEKLNEDPRGRMPDVAEKMLSRRLPEAEPSARLEPGEEGYDQLDLEAQEYE